jgi:hypothetical protein
VGSLSICTAMLASVGLAFADQPPCGKDELGRFWPDKADKNPVLAMQLARNGDLQVCSRSGWHYRWMQPAVRVDQLRSKRWKDPPIEGEADRRKPER